jgi:hypothetical protein
MRERETGCEDVDWINLAQDRSSGELLRTGNEHSGSIKGGGISWKDFGPPWN